MIDQEVALAIVYSGATLNVFYSMVKQVPGNLILISRMDSLGGGFYWMNQFDSLCTTYLMELRLIGTIDTIIAACGGHYN